MARELGMYGRLACRWTAIGVWDLLSIPLRTGATGVDSHCWAREILDRQGTIRGRSASASRRGIRGGARLREGPSGQRSSPRRPRRDFVGRAESDFAETRCRHTLADDLGERLPGEPTP